MFYYTFNSTVGELTIVADESNIKAIYFGGFDSEKKLTPLISKAVTQLQEYFSGTRKEFSLPLSPAGTDFQKKSLERSYSYSLWKNSILQGSC